MLSRSAINLYPKVMNYVAQPKSENTRVVLSILNMSDGKSSLLEIAEKYNFPLIEFSDTIEKLCDSKYIKEYKK